MVGITERNQQKLELTNAGFTLRYIDEWQPKTTLYRHKASYTLGGNISEGIGSAVKGVPGNPDYVLRKSKIGLFPWEPSDECECQWCKGSVQNKCDLCDFIASASTKAASKTSLTYHKRKAHK